MGLQKETAHALDTDAALPWNNVQAEDFSEPQPSTLPPAVALGYTVNTSQPVEESHWNELLWKLIGEGDVPAAYWLSRSLAAANLSCAVPAWLLAALHGAEWLSPESYMLIQDLAETARNHQLDEGAPHLEALRGSSRSATISNCSRHRAAGVAEVN